MKKRVKAKRRQPLRVSVVLSPDEHRRLADMANSTERSMSWLGRFGVRKLLDDFESHQLQLPLDLTDSRA